MVDPGTGMTALAVALGGKELIGKLLGPTADYLGGELKAFAAKRIETVGKIFVNASKKLGTKLNSEEGNVPPKVLKGILEDGSYSSDALTVEYFGGVLASSRSGISRDDRGAYFNSLVGRLSTYQLRAHYIFYTVVKNAFDGITANILMDEERKKLRIYLPYNDFARAMDLTREEINTFDSILMHIVNGLLKEELIDKYFESGPIEHMRQIVPNVKDGGLVFRPSLSGLELFLWAHGKGNAKLNDFFASDLQFTMDEPLPLPNGYQKVDGNAG